MPSRPVRRRTARRRREARPHPPGRRPPRAGRDEVVQDVLVLRPFCCFICKVFDDWKELLDDIFFDFRVNVRVGRGTRYVHGCLLVILFSQDRPPGTDCFCTGSGQSRNSPVLTCSTVAGDYASRAPQRTDIGCAGKIVFFGRAESVKGEIISFWSEKTSPKSPMGVRACFALFESPNMTSFENIHFLFYITTSDPT